MSAASVWETLGEAARQPDRGEMRLWEWLQEKVSLAQYRPEPAPGVVASHLTGRQGEYHILKNPRTKTYYRLSERDYFLWQRMDGTQTVKDLVVAYFMEYGSFAFGRAASLVGGLKANLFLKDLPVDVYRGVTRRLQNRSLPHRLGRVWHTFLQMQFAITGLDRFLERVYKWGGRFVYSRPAQVLFLVLTVVGLYLFTRVSRVGGFGLVAISGSYRLGIIGLIVANLASILVHEMAHALTVKHFGREVRRGGFMLYFGMPAFFVDTMDIWMEGKRARLAVTWAGPYSGLVLGGLASVVMTVWPEFGLNPLLYQFSFLCYLTVFFNLNPLLELDGYFILMDWLDIPMLRRKSLAFIRRGLWGKLKGIGQVRGKLWELLESFSREERIFTVFGALSAAWTGYAIFRATRFWQRRLAGAIGDLWKRGGGTGKTLLAVGIAAISLLLVVSIGMALLRAIKKGLRWLASQGVFADTRNVAAILLVVGVAVALGPGYVGYPSVARVFGVLALVGATLFSWRNAMDYRGSRFAAAYWLLGLGGLLLVPGLLLRVVEGEGGGLDAGWLVVSPVVSSIMVGGVGIVAYTSLLASSLVLIADTNLRKLRAGTKALLTLGLVASYGLVAFVVRGSEMPPLLGVDALSGISRALFPLVALTLVLPTLFSFWGTRFGPAWSLVGLGLGGLAASGLLGWSLLVPCFCLAAGLFLNRLAYVQVTAPTSWPDAQPVLSDQLRLQRAVHWTIASIYNQFREIAGERRARRVVEQFNSLVTAAGWRLSLVHGRVEDSMGGETNLMEHGARYADALSLLLDLVAQELGEKLTLRALQRAYDNLPWEEREIGAQYLFRDVKRAEALSQEFKEAQQDRRRLLRRNPLFATMDEAEIDLLVSRLSVERYARGQAIIRQGDTGARFYMVRRGQVVVTQRDERGVSEVVNQLGRGDAFGEVALLHDAPRSATCRATVPTEVLALERNDFDTMIRARFSLREKVDLFVTRANLLRRMPLFAELDASQIELVTAQLREEKYAQGAVIIRQGEIGETFYVIESGRVRVTVEEDGEEHLVAERARGEYAGEIALLLNVPRTATVTALTETHILALHRSDFYRLVADHLCVSRGLERETSRRMIDLQRAALTA